MPAINLSPALYQRLLHRSVSFSDTPEDVIRRLLDQTDEGDSPKAEDGLSPNDDPPPRPPAAVPLILPEGEYWVPILSTLAEAGGSAPANDVIDALEQRMGEDFRDRDRDRVRNGEVRWRNRARFARLRMKERGLLSKTSQRGIWEITDAGREYLERNRQAS